MLENTHLGEELASFKAFAPLRVILPEELQRFYAERGYLAAMPHEDRAYARLNVRAQGFIRFLSTSPIPNCDIIASDTRQGTILVKDISKTGIAFLYHRQIFPCEKLAIFLHGRALEATAIRCRRIGPQCYEIGAMINSVATVEADD
jgi:hypothetical protein